MDVLGKRERVDVDDIYRVRDPVEGPHPTNPASASSDTSYERNIGVEGNTGLRLKRPNAQDAWAPSPSHFVFPSSDLSTTKAVSSSSSSSSSSLSLLSQTPVTTSKPHKPVMKFLFPNEWIGQLIGKGGAIITQLNATTLATIKVSQTGEFYPNTRDRCVMCTSEKLENLYVAIDSVTGILITAQDHARCKCLLITSRA